MGSIGQNRGTHLEGLEGFESTCCTVEVSTWDRGDPTCTERVLCILGDGGDSCGKDFILLRTSVDGAIPPLCIGLRVDVVWPYCRNVSEESTQMGRDGADPLAGGSGYGGRAGLLERQPMR